mmetsp:Transcript_16830/g.41512  ORF Transcript_16830/g.41512 Transcript_16830/m.41512 type:complete len:258 (+) Transcript_16830:929-1702(+)
MAASTKGSTLPLISSTLADRSFQDGAGDASLPPSPPPLPGNVVRTGLPLPSPSPLASPSPVSPAAAATPRTRLLLSIRLRTLLSSPQSSTREAARSPSLSPPSSSGPPSYLHNPSAVPHQSHSQPFTVDPISPPPAPAPTRPRHARGSAQHTWPRSRCSSQYLPTRVNATRQFLPSCRQSCACTPAALRAHPPLPECRPRRYRRLAGSSTDTRRSARPAPSIERNNARPSEPSSAPVALRAAASPPRALCSSSCSSS